MVKVITPIGVVVDVEESIYEANKNTLKKYGNEESEKEPTTTSMNEGEVKNTVMKSPKSKK